MNKKLIRQFVATLDSSLLLAMREGYVFRVKTTGELIYAEVVDPAGTVIISQVGETPLTALAGAAHTLNKRLDASLDEEG